MISINCAGCQELASTAGSLAPSNASSTLFAQTDRPWPATSLELKYFFDEGGPIQRQKVRQICTEWGRWADIEFQEVTQKKDANIRIAFDPSKGNWSYVGIDSVAHLDDIGPTMNIGSVQETPEITPEEKGMILHEFGHALGMRNEHQAPVRGSKKNLLDVKKTIAGYEHMYGVSDDLVRRQAINVYNQKSVSDFSDLDLNSTMLYPVPGELTETGRGIAPNTELSEMDKAYMTINYPSKDDRYPAPGWSLKRALEIAGVPVDVDHTILLSAREGDVQTVRDAFSKWSMPKSKAAYTSAQEF